MSRKVQGEVEKALKRVEEGVNAFQELCRRAEAQSQREKAEADLKREIKKLQRLREQLRGWIGAPDLKDKQPAIEEAKSLIEREMEKYKIVERSFKTKAFSREGLSLGQQPSSPSAEAEKDRCRRAINGWLDQLQIEADLREAEIGVTAARTDRRLKWLKFHQDGLGQVLRSLESDELDSATFTRVSEAVEGFIGDFRSPDCVFGPPDLYSGVGVEFEDEPINEGTQTNNNNTIDDSAGVGATAAASMGTASAATSSTPIISGGTQQQQHQQQSSAVVVGGPSTAAATTNAPAPSSSDEREEEISSSSAAGITATGPPAVDHHEDECDKNYRSKVKRNVVKDISDIMQKGIDWFPNAALRLPHRIWYCEPHVADDIPNCFPKATLAQALSPTAFSKFNLDTLFFAFYMQPGTWQQAMSAFYLKAQGWRYHRKYITWFQPQSSVVEGTRGRWCYFDPFNGWCTRAKADFVFDATWL